MACKDLEKIMKNYNDPVVWQQYLSQHGNGSEVPPPPPYIYQRSSNVKKSLITWMHARDPRPDPAFAAMEADIDRRRAQGELV
jgi:hypothetical protein